MGAIAVAALVQILYQLDQYYKSLFALIWNNQLMLNEYLHGLVGYIRHI